MGGYLGSQVLYSGGNEKLAIAAEMQRAVGEMVIWPTDTPPIYWLLCYGQAIDRTTYAALFNVIGTTYGNGNGSTTFNIPDMRGRFALGQDDMGGSSANRVTATQADNLGQSSGAETHTLSTGELPSHSHPMDVNYPSAFGSTNPNLPYLNSNTIYATKQTGASGGGSTHNNMPPYVTLNFIIFTGV
jgi:microcystin-dependent protein